LVENVEIKMSDIFSNIDRIAGQFKQQDRSYPYQTSLSPEEQGKFAVWAAMNNVPVNLSKDSDYDMPGFYKAKQLGDAQARSGVSDLDNRMHFTDKFKTPSHKTFSAESQYATGGEPTWQGNALRYGDGTLNAMELPGGDILSAWSKMLKGKR
jgi:hypothetical protein